MWTHNIDNVTIECTSKDDKFSKWETLEQPLKNKLTESVRTAPKMVVDAISALNDLSSAFAPQRRARQWRSEAFQRRGPDRVANNRGVPNLDRTEVGQGLIKYFSLPSTNADYWRYITGIRGTFTIVLTNLKQPHKLVLCDMEDRGRVDLTWTWSGAREVGPIRQRFGFQDEWDHKVWLNRTPADIQISTWWVRDAPSAREVARTIVHEASHKWAFTTDVLYKHQSFAGAEPPNDPNRKSLNRSERIYGPEYGRQLRIRMPGRPRFFLPMMGFEAKDDPEDPNEPDVLISTEHWLENADSYAWFARRMYKRRSGALSDLLSCADWHQRDY